MPVIELDNFRKKYPDYNDIDDTTLAGKLASKYPDAYGDLPNKVTASSTSLPELRSGTPEPSLWERATSIFSDPGVDSAKAVQALVDADMLKIRPSEAMRYRDQIDQGVKINPAAAAKRSTLMERVNQSFDTGIKQNHIGELGYLYVQTGDPKYLDAINAVKMPAEADEFIPESRLEGAIRSAAKMLPMMGDAMIEGSGKGLQTGMALAEAVAIAGQMGPQIALPEEIITVPAAMATGFTAGSISGAFESSLRKEAGLALSEIIRFKDEAGNPIDPNIARAAAFGIGTINAGIEVAQIGTLLKTVPGLNKIFSKAVLETVGSKAVKDKLLSLAGQYSGTVAKETSQEVAQESTNIVFEELAKRVNNAVKGTDIKGTDAATVMKRLWDTAVESAQAFAVITAPGIGARAAMAGQKTEAQKVGQGAEKPVQGAQAQAKEAPERTYAGPIVLGTEENAEGNPTTFIMADQMTGQTFTVPAIEKAIGREGEKVQYEADPRRVAEAVAAIRLKEGKGGIDTTIDEIIQGDHNIDAVVDDWITREVMTDAERQGRQGQETQRTEGLLRNQEGATVAEPRPVLDILKNINAELGQRGSFSLKPGETKVPSLVLELGRSVYATGVKTFNEFTQAVKTAAGGLWAKIEPHVKAAWDTIQSERGSFSTKKTDSLSAEVKKAGGLDPDKLRLNHAWHEDIVEYGLTHLMRKGGLAPDDLASELQGRGIIGATPSEFAGPGDYLLSLLKDETTGREREGTQAKAEQAYLDKIKAETKTKEQQTKHDYQKGYEKGMEDVDHILAETVATEREKWFTENEKKYAQEIRDALKEAREAYKQGKTEGVKKGKARLEAALAKLEWMKDRRERLKDIRDFLDLSDQDMKRVSRKNPLLMSDEEFHEYAQDLYTRSVELKETQQAKFELINLINAKHLQKVENYRKAIDLPPIDEMTTEQLRKFADLLEPFENDDVFLTQRELETVDRAVILKGIKTWREAREILAKEAGVPVEDLDVVKMGKVDRFRWDTALMDQNPWYNVMVRKTVTAIFGAQMRAHEVETKAFELAKKADKSRSRSVGDRLIPQDKLLMTYLEAPSDMRAMLEKEMTPEQLDYAYFIQDYFRKALDYLIATKAIQKGRDNYITHIRKTFLEDWKDNGFKHAIQDLLVNFKQDEMVFNILDDDTGNILPLEKFFQFALHRTGYLDPSENVTRVFMTYVKTFEKKVALDAIIPELDIYVQSITPTTYTPRGLEMDRSLKKFLNQYINNKKGRQISFDSTIKQGGPVDMGIRALRTFTTLLDLGINPFVQIATVLGEQAMSFVSLGAKSLTLATARMNTAKGKEILAKYEAFTDRTLWEKFTAPGEQFTGRLMTGLFGGFHASNVLANKQFLLGSMTKEEWEAGELSSERITELRLDLARWRTVPGDNSLFGSTSLGKSSVQYKSWAIPAARTLIQDMHNVARDLKNKRPGEALTTREAKEVMRIIGSTAVVLMVGALSSGDDKDNSFMGQLKRKMYRESMSVLQSIDPSMWGGVPRTWQFIAELTKSMKQLVLLEEYKTKEGYKGWEGVKRNITPGIIRGLMKEDKKQ